MDKLKNQNELKIYGNKISYEIKNVKSFKIVNKIDKNIKQTKKDNIIIQKKYFPYKFNNLNNVKEYIILNIIILINILYPILSIDNYIKIKMKDAGYQEIINVNYIGKIIVEYNGNIVNLNKGENKINILEEEKYVKIKFGYQIRFTDFMFDNITNLIEVDLSNFDSTQISTMKFMFNNDINLEKIIIPNNFNTSLVENMDHLFSNCLLLKSLNLISFDTSKVINMGFMFYNCQSLTTLNLSGFNTEKVTSMLYIFLGCIHLISLDISNFNTKGINTTAQMFKNCNELRNIDLKSFDTSLVESMESMFDSCSSLEKLDLSNFNTEKVISMTSMFAKCNKLTSLNLSNFDTKEVLSMNNMFTGCRLLTSLDISKFDTSKVTNMAKMFDSCNELKSLDISNFKTQNLQITQKMFSNCRLLSSLDFKNFNTENVVNMQQMFLNCYSLTSLNLSNFITINVKNMEKMFEGCINLRYINFEKLSNESSPNISEMFLFVPENMIYCISSEGNIPNKLLEKACSINDCTNNWFENKENRLEEIKNNINMLNDKCLLQNIPEISKDFFISNKTDNEYIYSYKLDLHSSINELITKNKNLIFVDCNEENMSLFKKKFNLSKNRKNINNDSIYIIIKDKKSYDSNSATNDYEFIFVLENGTELNLNEITEDFYINVSMPIKNLELANFNYAIHFEKQGYDIYNISSNFYNDICAPAYYENNDIIIKDRKKYIYPNNVTFCKRNCKYKSIKTEEKRIVCECNLNKNKNHKRKKNNFFDTKVDGNFSSYFIDKINYKLFKCYKVILIFNNIKENIAFYFISIAFILILLLNINFFIFGLKKIRALMNKFIPDEVKEKEFIFSYLKKINQFNLKENNIHINSNNSSISNKNINKMIITKKNSENNIKNSFTYNLKSIRKKKKQNLNLMNPSLQLSFEKNENEKIKVNDNEKKEKIEDYNELPYVKALRLDKRNIFLVFKSILFNKLELINLIFSDSKFKIICLCEYILSLIFDFFINSLIYSDEIISQKYHNNGKLNFIVSLCLSLISNLITSIIFRFIKFSEKADKRNNQILKIKRERAFLLSLNKFLLAIKIKFFIFLFIEIIIFSFCFYYSTIFYIVYNQSQISVLINYFLSLIEAIITSTIISIIIVIIRQIGINFQNSYFYNTSKYINDNF